MKKKRGVWGVFYFLYDLEKLAKRGGGGYPQALPKVFNLQILLELSEILVLIGYPHHDLLTTIIYCERGKIQKANPKK